MLSQVDEHLLRDVFLRIDSDGDGLISVEDCLKLIKSSNITNSNINPNHHQQNLKPFLETFLQIADSDQDGKLDLTDFVASFGNGKPGLVPLHTISQVASNVSNCLTDNDIDELQIGFRVFESASSGDSSAGFLSENDLVNLLSCNFALCFHNEIDFPLKVSKIVSQAALANSCNKRLTMSQFICLAQDTNILPVTSFCTPMIVRIKNRILEKQKQYNKKKKKKDEKAGEKSNQEQDDENQQYSRSEEEEQEGEQSPLDLILLELQWFANNNLLSTKTSSTSTSGFSSAKSKTRGRVASLLRSETGAGVDAMISDTIASALVKEVELFLSDREFEETRQQQQQQEQHNMIMNVAETLFREEEKKKKKNKKNQDESLDEDGGEEQGSFSLHHAVSMWSMDGSRTSASSSAAANSETGRAMTNLQICRVIFDALDSRRKKSLVASDINFLLSRKASVSLSPAAAQQSLFALYDRDGDSELSFAEFLTALSPCMVNSEEEEEEEDDQDEEDEDNASCSSEEYDQKQKRKQQHQQQDGEGEEEAEGKRRKILVPSLIDSASIQSCQQSLSFLRSCDAELLNKTLPEFPNNSLERFVTCVANCLTTKHQERQRQSKSNNGFNVTKRFVLDSILIVASNGFFHRCRQQQPQGEEGRELEEASLEAIRNFQQLVKFDATMMMQLSCVMTTRALSLRNVLALFHDHNDNDNNNEKEEEKEETQLSIPRSVLEDAFSVLDVKKSGLLELEQLLPIVKRNFTSNRFDARLVHRVAVSLFNFFDKDGDGKLNLNEFISACCSSPFALLSYSDLLAEIHEIEEAGNDNNNNSNSAAAGGTSQRDSRVSTAPGGFRPTTTKNSSSSSSTKNNNNNNNIASFELDEKLNNNNNQQNENKNDRKGHDESNNRNSMRVRGGRSTPDQSLRFHQVTRSSLPHTDLAYIRHLFHSLDTKKDNVIDFEELCSRSASSLLGDPKGRLSREGLENAAAKFLEANGKNRENGVLSLDEFISCFVRGLATVPKASRNSASSASSPLYFYAPPGATASSAASGGSGSSVASSSSSSSAKVVRSWSPPVSPTLSSASASSSQHQHQHQRRASSGGGGGRSSFDKRRPSPISASATAAAASSSGGGARKGSTVRRTGSSSSPVGSPLSVSSPGSVEQLRYLFSFIDRNRNGLISREELEQLLNEFLETYFQNDSERLKRFTAEMMQEIFSQDDNNNNNNEKEKGFTFEQFVAAFERNPDLMRVSLDAARIRVERTEAELERLLREEDLRKIAKVFVSLDKDGNGVLEFEEVHDELFQLIRNQYPDWSVVDVERTVRSIFDSADVDSNGCWDFEEFVQEYYYSDFIESHAAQMRRELTAEEIEELKSLFQVMDADNDGRVSGEDLEQLVASALKNDMQHRDDPATVSAIVEGVLAVADRNRHGFIEFRDFLNAYAQGSQLLDIPIMAAAARRESAQKRMQELLCAHDLRDIAKVFLILDKNGDGYLQADELRTSIESQLRRLQPQMPAEKIDEAVMAVFSAADSNQDGQVSLDEFIESFVQGHYLLPPSFVRDVAASFSRSLSSEEVEQLVALFQKIDVNGDGSITQHELESSLREAVGRETAEVIGNVIMTVADENMDGVLSIQEFLRCYQLDNGLLTVPISGMSSSTLSHVAERLIPKEGLRSLGKMFHRIDTDGDGFVDTEELATALQLFGTVTAQTEEGLLDVARAKILAHDLDGDGKLSFDEWIASYANVAGGNDSTFHLIPWETIQCECASPRRGRTPGADEGEREGESDIEKKNNNKTASSSSSANYYYGVPNNDSIATQAPSLEGSGVQELGTAVAAVTAAVASKEENQEEEKREQTTRDRIPRPPPTSSTSTSMASTAVVASSSSSSSAVSTTNPRRHRYSSASRYSKRAHHTIGEKTSSRKLSEREISELRREFDNYDKNKNGHLELAEFKKAYEKMEDFGLPMSSTQMNMLFGSLASKEGKLNFNGFCVAMLRRNRL